MTIVYKSRWDFSADLEMTCAGTTFFYFEQQSAIMESSK